MVSKVAVVGSGTVADVWFHLDKNETRRTWGPRRVAQVRRVWLDGDIYPWDVVRRPGNDVSVLLLTGGPGTIRQGSIACLLSSEDLLLRLKPVIEWTLTDAPFVVFEGTFGDAFIECCGHRRRRRLWCRSTGKSLARCLRFGRGLQVDGLLRFHESLPRSSIMNQIGDGKARPCLGRCQGQSVAACDGFTSREG